MLRRKLWLLLTVAILVCSTSLMGITVAPPSPTISVDPSSIVGDVTPAPGSVITLKINVSDIPDPGLWGFEFYMSVDPTVFPPIVPLTNMNFTSDAAGWSTTPTVTTGTASYGYDAGDGNPAGSGAGSYYVRADSTASDTAYITFLTEQTFAWPLGTPLSAWLSFSTKITGNSVGSNCYVQIRVQKPSAAYKTLMPNKYFSTTEPWTYEHRTASASAFDETGTYQFQIRTRLKTADVGVGKYVQVNYDDIGIELAPVSATEGPFLPPGGTTFFVAKYFKAGYIYVADSLTGTPYVDAFPQVGSGSITTVKILVDYGGTELDLYDTKLLTVGLPPSYPPVELTHTAEDGYFRNTIPGDMTDDTPGVPPDYPDGDVDGFDFGAFADAFGSSVGQPNYNILADLTDDSPGVPPDLPDGHVDGFDFGVFADNFGRSI